MKFIVLAILILTLPDLYIWFSFVRGNVGLVWKILYWVPLLATLMCIGFALMGVHQPLLLKLFFMLLLCIAIPKLLFTVVSLAGRGVGLLLPAAAKIGNWTGVAVSFVSIGIFIYGLTSGWKELVTKEITETSADVPEAFNGYRLVQLSDIHIGTFIGNEEFVQRLVKEVNDLHPDLIVFTGDLVNSSADELDNFMEILPQLRAKDGVYSILGNHDYCEYHHYDTPDGARSNLREVIRRERGFGWDVLLNEHRFIHRGTDSIAIIGVENEGKPPFPSFADLPKAMKGVSDDVYKILLSHDPSHWRREVLPETDIQLTLSGHTHAMQLMIGNFSPAQWAYREWGGAYQEDKHMLYVSLGIGGTVPFRFGAWPEINVITLKRPE